MAKKKKKKESKTEFKPSLFNARLPKVKTLSRAQIRGKLSSTRERTLKRILESKGASPITKAKARRMLENGT